MSIHKWLNWPKREARTLSPGLSVLVTAASQQPVPDDGKTKGVPVVVRNSFFRPGAICSQSEGNLGERWSSIDTT